MTIASFICFHLARQRMLKQAGLLHSEPGWSAGANPNVYDASSYQSWREAELERQFKTYFDPNIFTGKDVLDFGCGGGELSLLCAQYSPRSILAMELNPRQYQLAANRFANVTVPVRPRGLLATDAASIPLKAEECDIILCFDVLEHIIAYESIIKEWYRVLRTRGKILIWWVPYYHPYGHHLENLLPVPWLHLLFSDRALLAACARIYDAVEYRPRLWDVDRYGQKLPNKFRDMTELPDLNKLTIRNFEKIIRRQGFAINRREYHPVSSSKLSHRISSCLIRVPAIRECVTACVVYQLEKT